MTRATKTEKIIVLRPYGKYLGIANSKFIIRNKQRTAQEETPFFRVGEIILQTGNTVSTGALASAGFWGIDVLIMTSAGRPVSTMIALDDNSHVQTRISQYEAIKTEKAVEIAKQLVIAKIEGQTQTLKKYGLVSFENANLPRKEQIAKMYAEHVDKIRTQLHVAESNYARHYFKQIIGLFPEQLKKNWKKREGYRAYGKLNNLFNFAYEVLQWKIHRALIKAKLEPYLGFLHGIQKNRPSLVCDFTEIYRVLIDNFLIEYSQKLTQKDFERHYEKGYYEKKIPRLYLKHSETNKIIESLSKYFMVKVKIPLARRGKKQSLQTLINEEAKLFAMYLRNERKEWKPRILIPE